MNVIPDIAIKDKKVYAVESIWNGIPNYSKYDKEITKWFDDIIWLDHRKKPKIRDRV